MNNRFESECEICSTAYLMTLFIALIGLPIPILSFIATLIFGLVYRKHHSEFVRWHTLQVVLSQIPLVVMNAIGITWTIRVLTGATLLSNAYFAYLATDIFVNTLEMGAAIYTAIQVRKGKDSKWLFYAPLTDAIMHLSNKGVATKLFRQAAGLLSIPIIFFLMMFSIPWMHTFKIHPDTMEKKLGGLVYKSLQLEYDFYNDGKVKSVADTLLTQLCAANGIDREKIHLGIVHSDEINAFSFIGNHIIVCDKLIATCSQPQELMAVIAHELAHIEHKDTSDKTYTLLLWNIIYDNTIGGNTGGQVVKGMVKSITEASFSRGIERKADDEAVKYLDRAGVSPRYLADFFKTLQKRENEWQPYLKWLNSHPQTQKRIERIEKNMLSKEYHNYVMLHNATWQEAKKIVEKNVEN